MKKPILPRPVAIALAACLGLSGGFALRHGTHRPAASAGTESSAQAAMAAAGSSSAADAGAADQGKTDLRRFTEQTVSDLTFSTGVTRWLHWIGSLEGASLDDLPALAKITKDHSVALRMVAARWIEIDPNHLFETILRHSGQGRDSGFPSLSLVDHLFEQWLKTDPQAAANALDRPEAQRFRYLRYQVAGAMIETDPELGLTYFQKWRISHIGPNTKGIEAWAARDPRHAAQFALDHPAGYVTEVALEAIGKVWSQTDPAAAMDFAVKLPGTTRDRMATQVLSAWADRDPGKAAAWLATSTPAVQRLLYPTFMRKWAEKDAAAALDWSRQNFDGRLRADAVAGIVQGLATKDRAGAAALVLSLEPSPERAAAAAALAPDLLPGWDQPQPISQEALSWLKALDGDSLRKVFSETSAWEYYDPEGFRAFLLTDAGRHVPKLTLQRVARDFAASKPLEAMKWATQLPEEFRMMSQGNVLARWLVNQPREATAWLQEAGLSPDDRARLFAGAVEQASWSPKGSEALAALPEPLRTEARNILQQRAPLTEANNE